MHPPDDPVSALTALLSNRGFDVEVILDPDGVTAVEGVDLLIVAACWFSMSDARYDSSQRSSWAVERNERRESALAAAADAGVPLLGMHTAVICFDNWPVWAQWLGGCWDWSTSNHPAPAEITVAAEPGARPAIKPFTVVDEEYRGLRLDPDIEIIARSASGHPLAWFNDRGDGRTAAVSLLGHDKRSLDEPGHRAMLDLLIDRLLDPTAPPIPGAMAR